MIRFLAWFPNEGTAKLLDGLAECHGERACFHLIAFSFVKQRRRHTDGVACEVVTSAGGKVHCLAGFSEAGLEDRLWNTLFG